MATTKLRETVVTTVGEPPAVGDALIPFRLTLPDLTEFASAELAGHRVVVVPAAVMTTAFEPGHRDDRRDALTLRMAWTGWTLLPFALIWSLLAGVVRAAVRLVLKQPQLSWDELVAAGDLLARPAISSTRALIGC